MRAAPGHSVWAQLASQLYTIRDPAALPGWLAATTRRECGRALRAAQGTHDAALAPDAEIVPDDHATAAEQELLMAERHTAFRKAFAHLPPCCQQLIILLTRNPPAVIRQRPAALVTSAGTVPPAGVCQRHAALHRVGRMSVAVLMVSLGDIQVAQRETLDGRMNSESAEASGIRSQDIS